MVNVKNLGERYEISEKIAAGGMGIIYRGLDTRLNRLVAIKILKAHLSHDERFVERFRREARAVASLSHPNIASLYDYGEDDGRHFIVMECVEGRDLAVVLRDEGPLEPDRAARIAQQIADALSVAHASGIIHRDIKPANVLLTDEGVAKVTDFGIARAMGDSTLTATGSILGTAHYLAPEQASGQPATPATDVYATGIVLFEMLTGTVPFTGDSPVVVATRHLNDNLPSARSINPSVPSVLDAVVRSATAKEPRERYRDGASLSRALEVAREGASAPVAPTTAETTEVAGPIGGTVELPGLAARVATGTVPAIASAMRKLRSPSISDGWRSRRIPLVIIAGLSALTLALLAFRLIEDPKPQRTASGRSGAEDKQPGQEPPTQPVATMVTVPNVVGLEAKDAKKTLESAQLVVQISGEEKWRVVEMQPPAGSDVEEGRTVTLITVAPEGDDEGHENDEGGPPEHAEGHGESKKEEKDKEEDD